MHSKDCELLFGSDIQNFPEWLLMVRAKSAKKTMIANTPAEAEVFIYTKKKRGKTHETSQRTPATFQCITASSSDSAL